MDICPVALYRNLCDDLTTCTGMQFPLSDTTFWPGCTTTEASALSIQSSLLRKLEVENSAEHDAKALSKFLESNLLCRDWSLDFRDSWDEVLFGEFKRSLNNFLSFPSLIGDSFSDVFHNGRVGPGAAVGARGASFYTKLFSSPLTSTSHGLYLAYKNYIGNFPEWINAEFIRTEHYGSVDIVEGNRLSFVPKNDQISRTICVEPSLNMFAQLGLGRQIELRLLSHFGINLSDQQFKNRELARKGSLSDSFVTIDLASASDSISLKMLDTVCPRFFTGMLRCLRSPSVRLPKAGYTELHMVSSMGNGFTFPLQTAIFACIVEAAARARGFNLLRPRGNDHGNFGVFGDDIICDVSIHRDVLRLLRLLGFRVNPDKTFVEGPFRESCGADFYLGVNIRGVYVKRLHTQQDLVSVINQLNLFSTRTGIRLPKCVQYLLSFTKWIPVPRSENDSSGIKVPFSMVKREIPVNFNGSSLYRSYEPVGLKVRILHDRIIVPKGSKRLIYNPSGLLMSFLQRSINSCTYNVRHDAVRYKRKLRVIPFWDSTPAIHPLSGWFNWQRWDTAVYLNLFG